MIHVSLATEGLLDEQILRRLISQCRRDLVANVCYGRRGRDHLARNLPRFNKAAAHQPFLVVADLEHDNCAPGLIRQWLPGGNHQNLILRIAVRKIEAWLLADRQTFSAFLGISVAHLPLKPDELDDPKVHVVNLARRSRSKTIREDIVPANKSTSSIGRNYTGRLSQFVMEEWDVERAAKHSLSLERALSALRAFSPVSPNSE